MIRINLLPSVKIDTKRRKFRNQLIIAGVVILLELGAMAGVASKVGGDLNDVKDKITRDEARLKKLEQTEAELKKYEEVNRKLQERIDTIVNLEKSKTGPVLMFDVLSQAIPEVLAKPGERTS